MSGWMRMCLVILRQLTNRVGDQIFQGRILVVLEPFQKFVDKNVHEIFVFQFEY